MHTGLIERFTLPRWPFQLNYQSEQAKLLTGWYPVLPWEHDAKLADLTASARNITSVTGTPVLSPADLRHSVALAFDGSTNYIQFSTVSAYLSASAGAFSCWVRPMDSSYGTNSPAWLLKGIMADGGGNLGLVIGDIGGTTGQKIHAYNYTGSTQTVSALATFEQYRWYHVVWAHSGGTLYLYIDGLLQGSVASGNSNVAVALHAAQGQGGNANLEMADIRYYSDKPSDEVIWQMYSPATRWDLYARPHARSMECFGIVPGGTSYTLTADSGAFVWTGTAGVLKIARRIAAATSSCTITGTAASVKLARKITADSTSVSITGSQATIRISRRIAADSGSVALTGANASLILARRFVAGAVSYAITGIDAALKIARRIAAAAASVIITGTDAGFSSSNNKTINAESGSVSISGSAATLRIARVLSAQSGSYSLAGTDAGLKMARRVPCDTGAFVVTGQSATVLLGKRFTAQPGSFSIDGTLANLLLARRITASSSAYLITGIPAAVIYSGGRVIRRLVFTDQAMQRPSIASESCAVPAVTGESVL